MSALLGAMAAILFCSRCLAQTKSGIPEPGVCLYGAVANTNGFVPFLGSGMFLAITDGSSTIHLTPSLVTVNSQVYYVALVPFETRSIPGGPTFPATSNTFELTATSTPYTCSATVNGANATLQNPATFTCGRSERGRSARLDLVVNTPRETFAQWSQRVLGQVVDRNADPLGKGMTYYQQYIAGTDPLDPQSLFKVIGIQPAPPSGIGIQWSSVTNHTYSIQVASNVLGPFGSLATNVQATPPINIYTDPNALTRTNSFYRVQAE